MSATAPASHTLVNRRGDRVELMTFGARIRSLTLALPGGPRNVVLGYASPGAYRSDRYFMGGTIGRYANRIGGARFAIDGREHPLAANEGRHTLHGGPQGFHLRDWELQPGADERTAELRLVSADGDQGFPGELAVAVRYTWGDDRELEVRHVAATTKPTHVSLTNHAYWNLNGGGDAREQRLAVAAARYTPTDRERIPTGAVADVAGTPFDLRALCVLRERLDALEQVNARERRERRERFAQQGPEPADGLDCNYVLDTLAPGAAHATLQSARGDLSMALETTLPGLQVYTGQHLRAPFTPFAGICLEPQQFPDAPNRPEFPASLLRAGERCEHWSRYRFAA